MRRDYYGSFYLLACEKKCRNDDQWRRWDQSYILQRRQSGGDDDDVDMLILDGGTVAGAEAFAWMYIPSTRRLPSSCFLRDKRDATLD